MRALIAEREARATAEREAATQKARADELAKASETEAQTLKREAQEGKTLAAQGQENLRRANALIGLTGLGLAGPKAHAAFRLLDGLEYDDQCRPTNLETRLTAAKAVYGEEIFAGATPAPTPDPTDPGAIPPLPEVHQGPRLPATADEDAQFEAYMRQHFPHLQPAPVNSG